MKKLLMNNIRNLKHLIFQCVAILILVIFTTLLIGGLFSSNFQLKKTADNFLSQSPAADYNLLGNLQPSPDGLIISDSGFPITVKAQQYLPEPYRSMLDLNYLMQHNWKPDFFNNDKTSDDNPDLQELNIEYYNGFTPYIMDKIVDELVKNGTYKTNDLKLSPFLNANVPRNYTNLNLDIKFYGNLKSKPLKHDYLKRFMPSVAGGTLLVGRMPEKWNEVLLDYNDAQSTNCPLKINDTFKVYWSLDQTLIFKVVGYASSSSDNPFTNQGKINKVHFFTTPDIMFNSLLQMYWQKNLKSNLSFAWGQNIQVKANLSLTPFYNQLKSVFNLPYDNPAAIIYKNGPNQLLKTTQYIFILYFTIGIIVLIVVGYLLSFFIVSQINHLKSQIGILKAMGYSTYQLTLSFVSFIGILSFIGAAVGYIGSIFLQNFVIGALTSVISIPLNDYYFSFEVFLIAIIGIPLFLSAVAGIKIYANLKQSPLSLLRGENAIIGSVWIFIKKITNWWSKNFGFKFRIGVSIIIQQISKLFFLIPLFILISVLITLQLILNDMNHSTLEEYKNQFKNPDETISYSIDGEPYYWGWNKTGKFIQKDKPKFFWTNINTAQNKIITTETKLDDFIQNNTDFNGCRLQSHLVKELLENTNPHGYHFNSIVKDKINEYIKNTHTYPNLNFGNIFYNPQTTYMYHKSEIKFKVHNLDFDSFEFMTVNEKNYQQYFNWDIDESAKAKFFKPLSGEERIDWGTKANPIPILISKQIRINYPQLAINKSLPVALTFYNADKVENLWCMPVGEVKNDIFQPTAYIPNHEIQTILKHDIFNTNQLGKTNPAVQSYPNVYNDAFLTQGELNYAKQNIVLPRIYFHSKQVKLTADYFIEGKPSNLNQSGLGLIKTSLLSSNFNLPFNPVVTSGFAPGDVFKSVYNMTQSPIASVLNDFSAIVIVQVFLGLIMIVNIVIEKNNQFILILKILGYKIREATSLIVSYYLITIAVSYFIGIAVSYAIAALIQSMILQLAGLPVALPLNWVTIVVTLIIIAVILGIAYAVSIYNVRQIPINKIAFEE